MTGSTERNRSLWMATDPPTDAFAALAGDLEVDVCVIGAGITGLMSAYALKEQGASVAVIDRDRVGTGVTGYTTGKVTSLHGLTYASLEERYSAEVARLYGEANQFGMREVARIAEQHSIDCDLRTLPAFTYTEKDETLQTIESEAAAAQRAGLPASFVTETELPFKVAGAVRFDDQVHFHPRRFLDGLAKVVGNVYERTAAMDVDESNGWCTVETPAGTIRAEHVIVATQMPFMHRGMFYAKAYPTRSYAIAGPHDGPPMGMYLSADAPARSIRPHISGDRTWLIVGGEGHKVGQHDGDTERHYDALESWADVHFDLRPDTRWSAQDFVPADDIPYIGRASRFTHRVFVATGYKKWGLSTAGFASKLIADLIGGRDNPWLSVFDATRIDPRHAGKELVKENVDVAKRFIGDRLADARARKIESLERGEGDVVDNGFRVVAAFRDDDGTLHQVSPVCTHLGCHLRFNSAERSWDCPCHGSRFDVDGAVLEGPALHPLDPVEPPDEVRDTG
jgi:glycine/D-amino acid oxidase-like deaminating enzyme/nitrite reductase/ring-hydroxylating ferredoxin subunit